MDVCVTVDLEHDCPPFLHSYRGVEQGMPRLLRLLGEACVPATFFTTGDVARRYPEVVRRLVADGHELGCHGDTHRRFSTLDAAQAEQEIGTASAKLREFAQVRSFRAPNLDFPAAYLPILRQHGYLVDSSEGRHKPGSLWRRPSRTGSLLRVPASMAPSALRLPGPLRDGLCRLLRDPVVFFFHPWEFVDMTRTAIPIDCRFRTGEPALVALEQTIAHFKRRGARFRRIGELATT